MNLLFLTKDLRISQKKFGAAFFLSSGSLAWYFLISNYLPTILTAMTPDFTLAITGQVVFFVTGIVSAVIGSIVSQKANLKNFLVSGKTPRSDERLLHRQT